MKLVLNRLSLIGEVGTSIRLSVQVNLCIVLLLLLSPEWMHFLLHTKVVLNPITLGMVKTLWSFGHSECNRVKSVTRQIIKSGFDNFRVTQLSQAVGTLL